MEIENKDRYRVHIKYDKETLTTFVKFYNSVKHPRATLFMFTTGLMMFALPFVNHDIALPGQIVCYVVGPIMFLLSLFRQNISVLMMKDSDDMKIGEDIIYHFSNTGVTVEKSAGTEHMGNYKKIYRIWENEFTFFVGMNEDDLIVLPKDKFEEGDTETFRDFVIEKSHCIYTWKPVKLWNSIKWKWMQFRTRDHIKKVEAQEEANEKK